MNQDHAEILIYSNGLWNPKFVAEGEKTIRVSCPNCGVRTKRLALTSADNDQCDKCRYKPCMLLQLYECQNEMWVEVDLEDLEGDGSEKR